MSINQLSFLISFTLLYGVLTMVQLLGRAFLSEDHDHMVSAVQRLLILLFSLYFIAQASVSFICVVSFEIFWTWGAGLVLEKSRGPAGHRFVSGVCILVPLALLFYFKYYSFFAGELARLLGFDTGSLSIVAPIGIAFYTLSILSYLIDVKRGDIPAERNPVNMALFIAFFPKIVSGPIVRATEFLPQLRRYRGFTLSDLSAGIQIFVFGLFKKMVLADHLGVFVDDVFRAPSAYATPTVWLAVIGYTLQIYLDFSGYTDMATGLARMLGLEFPRNFNLPYLARNMPDFWNRWHISLSRWLKDYIYFPLGGSRAGRSRTYLNLLITMTVSGLWHGTGYTYILWGVLHGIVSCIHRLFREICRDRNRVRGWGAAEETAGGKGGGQMLPSADRKEMAGVAASTTQSPDNNHSVVRGHTASGKFITGLKSMLSVLATFMTFAVLQVVFRAEDLSNAAAMFASMLTLHDGIQQPYTWVFAAGLILLAAYAVAVHRNREQGNTAHPDGFYPVMSLDSIPTLTIFFVFVGITILFGYYGDTSFIYGKF